MENNQLPADVQSRIEADADQYVKGLSIKHSKAHQHAGYVAGATAERERAQVVIDALEQFISYHETGLLPARHVYEKAVAARKQWKGERKEVGNAKK